MSIVSGEFYKKITVAISSIQKAYLSPKFKGSMDNQQSWRSFFIVRNRFAFYGIAIGIMLRMAWLFVFPTPPTGDGIAYYRYANRIANGLGYVSSLGDPTSIWARIAYNLGYSVAKSEPMNFWPPGYVYSLGWVFSLFGSGPIVGWMLNLVLAAGCMILVYMLAKIVSGNQRVAVLAVFLLALHPNQIAYTSLHLSEILFEFLLLASLGLWLFAKKNLRIMSGPRLSLLSIFSGMIFSAGCLVKPQFVIVLIALPPFFMLTDVPRRRLGLIAAMFALGASVVLAPWIVRNYTIWNRLIPFSTNGGINLLIALGPKANGDFMNVDLAECLSAEDLRKLPKLNDVERDELYRKYAIRFALKSPAKVLDLAMRKQFCTWYSDADGYSMNIACDTGWSGFNSQDKVIKWIFQSYYIFIIVLLGYLLVCHFKDVDFSLLMLVGVLMSVYLVFHGNVRFHFPVMPILDLYAAWGGVFAVASLQKKTGE